MGGKGVICLVASDGMRSSEVEAAPIDVPARAPMAYILAPAPGTTVSFGQPLSVLGYCLNMGGQPCAPDSITWSLDSEIEARGTPVAALEGLRPGTHRLTLSDGEPDRDCVEVSVSFDVDAPDADRMQWQASFADVHRTSGAQSDQGREIL
jgi:hypothetical protein